MEWIPSGSNAVSAAPISLPSSIVPVVSTATCTNTGKSRAVRRHGPLRADHRRLGLQQVLTGLDHDGVDATLEHAGDLLLVGVAKRGESGVPEGGQFGAGPHGSEHETRTAVGAERVRLLPGQRRARQRQLEDPFGDVVLTEVGQIGPEGVRLDEVDAGLQIRPVDRADDVGPGDVEDFVASLEPREVVKARVVLLQHRAHRAVRDQHALRQRVEQGRCGRWCHRSRVVRRVVVPWPGERTA